MEFINEFEIFSLIDDRKLNDPALQKEIIEKSKEAKGLTLRESAALLNISSPEILEEMFATAKEVKEKIYGNRLVLFAPLYLTNLCVNNCLYCAFRKDNKELKRKTLTIEEVREETEFLVSQGHKRVLLVCGEHPKKASMEFIGEAIKTVYDVKIKNGNIRRLNVNTAPLSIEDFRTLKSFGIGTYQCFQETYHYDTYLVKNVEELNNQREELEATLFYLKETQEKLFQSEKLASIGVLATGVAHEINNPLNFINGGIQGIETYFNDNLKDHAENVYPLIEAVNTGLTRATEIVKSLNSFSRQTESTTENCDIHTIVNNCLIMLNSQTINRIEIQKEFTPELYELYGNEGKLHQAMMNVLTNAVQAIEGKGTIKIKTCIKNSTIIITISDTGYGISSKILNKIFDPFFTTREQGMGKGLGLSISYQIIKEHNGTIDIQSEIGKWTTVIISIPILIKTHI